MGDTGKINAETNLYNLEPTFTFGLSKDISSSDKKKIESAISVYDIPSENIVKTWEGSKLTISFNKALEAEKTYVISMEKTIDFEKISMEVFEDISFSTKAIYC